MGNRGVEVKQNGRLSYVDSFECMVEGHTAVATHRTASSILAGVRAAVINVGLAGVTRVASLTCACVAVDTILVCVCVSG